MKIAKTHYILTSKYTDPMDDEVLEEKMGCESLDQLRGLIAMRLGDDYRLSTLSVVKQTLEVTKEEVLSIADIL